MGAHGPDGLAIISLIIIAALLLWRWQAARHGRRAAVAPPETVPAPPPVVVPSPLPSEDEPLLTLPDDDGDDLADLHAAVLRLADEQQTPAAIAEQLDLAVDEVELILKRQALAPKS